MGKNGENEYFHFTSVDSIPSIMQNGLQCQFGKNCLFLGDKKGEKISYSIGKEKAIEMFDLIFWRYLRCKEYGYNRDSFSKKSIEVIEQLLKTDSFEEWQGSGVFLKIDSIDDSEKNEEKPEDSYTKKTISPDKLKVCAIREKNTGRIISYSNFDVICYWLSQETEKYRDNNYPLIKYMFSDKKMYDAKIAEYSTGKYELSYIDIREMEMYLSIRPEQIGARTMDVSTESKRNISSVFKAFKNKIMGRLK